MFTASTFLAGGTKNGFACPDNLVFDPRGNLWLCTDIASHDLYGLVYAPFKNNGLFYISLCRAHMPAYRYRWLLPRRARN